ncbi:MAG: hypothetical protein JKY45_11875 [Emcibacter sp.]|nr:hypothetical protein [Emcibacter sp.]
MMRIRLLYLSCLSMLCIVTAQINSAQADQSNWTEEKVGKLAVKADRAATRKKWSLAIKYGEKMLKGSAVLYEVNDPTYITHLKNLNRYYDKFGRLTEVAGRVKLAYELAKAHLDPSHSVATTCRVLYYKLLITQKKYPKAIPVVYLNMSTLTKSKDDQFRKLHYYRQLYALYGLTEQLEKEEQALLNYIHLHENLIGKLKANDNLKGDKDDVLILKRLIQNYCRRKMPDKIKVLTKKYDLKYTCN